MANISKGPDCVILLHGLGRTARSMSRLEKSFSKLGYRVVNLTYPSRKHPIEKLSQLAIEPALDMCNLTAGTKVHFVTHSLGGIIVRYYLEQDLRKNNKSRRLSLSKSTSTSSVCVSPVEYTKLQNLGRVVMIAPPNKGSQVVDKLGHLPGFVAINGPAGIQLGTDSQSIPLKLGAVTYPVGVIAGTRSVNFLLSQFLPGVNDGRVTTENTRVEGMSDYIELPASHPFIIQNANAIRQATNFISAGNFQRV